MGKYSWPQTIMESSVGAEFVHAIGVITVNWSIAETTLCGLIGIYLHDTKDVGPLVTTNIGNVSRCDLLKGLVKAREKDPNTAAAVLHGVHCFDIGRENRNLLVHNTPLSSYAGSYLSVTKGRHQIVSSFADMSIELYERVAREIATLDEFLWRVRFHIEYGEPLPSLSTLPKPDRLNCTLQFVPSGSPPPPPSPG